jgi:glycosyltransferase involved in cell wall biosynthesis
MPIHNCRTFVAEAVRSILSQSFTDYELIVIDDASTDGSADEVRTFADSRIRIIQNERNVRVAGSLNNGLAIARGRYIARMDGDDISVPGRLAAQFAFMEANPDIGVCGGWVTYFGVGIPHVFRPPTAPLELAAFMLFQNPLCHPTVMLRRSCLDSAALQYDTAFTFSEDYDLWTRLAPHTRLANLPSVLVHIRQHPSSVSREFAATMTAQTNVILRRMFRHLNLNPDEEAIQFHFRIGRGSRLDSMGELDRAEAWLQELLQLNERVKGFDAAAFRRVTGQVWFRVCANSTPLGLGLWRRWKLSPLNTGSHPASGELCRFVLSMLWHVLRRRSSVPV